MTTLGTRVAILRKQPGPTPPTLADRIGIHVSHVRRYKDALLRHQARRLASFER
jgi:hypothetical protein